MFAGAVWMPPSGSRTARTGDPWRTDVADAAPGAGGAERASGGRPTGGGGIRIPSHTQLP